MKNNIESLDEICLTQEELVSINGGGEIAEDIGQAIGTMIGATICAGVCLTKAVMDAWVGKVIK